MGVTFVFAHQVVRGKRMLPISGMDDWTDALGLKGPGRQEFVTRVLLDHAPPELSAAFEKLESEVAQLQAEVKRLKAGQKASNRRKKSNG